MAERWLVTGGCGFIGSNFVLSARRQGIAAILNLDLLTYAGNEDNLALLSDDPGYCLLRGDIADGKAVRKALADFSPTAIFHFAAESHVDRSIEGPAVFLRTNVEGTFTLLEEARRYWSALPPAAREGFRFLHVSTDEVFGSLSPSDPPFTEWTPYAPNSPYAASKAASDHFVRAWHHTFGLPVLTTNCSNNFGPFQFPEKLIPTVILSALKEKEVPLYGDGQNIRDWLYVEDHCSAILRVWEKGRTGETYNIGGGNEKTNRDIVEAILSILDAKRPRLSGASYRELIRFVPDRPGHDRRYAMDGSRIKKELGWIPSRDFDTALKDTVDWYLENVSWWKALESRHEAGTRQGLLPGGIPGAVEQR
uniref:dTDP-glucose 4,6-dehydratase n=1 Tax=Leptospirillum ferriphilum TaxID=178606 RepID=A0A7C3LSY4_9BACT